MKIKPQESLNVTVTLFFFQELGTEGLSQELFVHIFSAHVTLVQQYHLHTKTQIILVGAHKIMRNISLLNILWDI